LVDDEEEVDIGDKEEEDEEAVQFEVVLQT
jgi:hypothetical protein